MANEPALAPLSGAVGKWPANRLGSSVLLGEPRSKASPLKQVIGDTQRFRREQQTAHSERLNQGKVWLSMERQLIDSAKEQGSALEGLENRYAQLTSSTRELLDAAMRLGTLLPAVSVSTTVMAPLSRAPRSSPASPSQPTTGGRGAQVAERPGDIIRKTLVDGGKSPPQPATGGPNAPVPEGPGDIMRNAVMDAGKSLALFGTLLGGVVVARRAPGLLNKGLAKVRGEHGSVGAAVSAGIRQVPAVVGEKWTAARQWLGGPNSGGVLQRIKEAPGRTLGALAQARAQPGGIGGAIMQRVRQAPAALGTGLAGAGQWLGERAGAAGRTVLGAAKSAASWRPPGTPTGPLWSRIKAAANPLTNKLTFLDAGLKAAYTYQTATTAQEKGEGYGAAIGALGGTIIGTALGGPAGAFIGNFLGDKLGGAIGKALFAGDEKPKTNPGSAAQPSATTSNAAAPPGSSATAEPVWKGPGDVVASLRETERSAPAPRAEQASAVTTTMPPAPINQQFTLTANMPVTFTNSLDDPLVRQRLEAIARAQFDALMSQARDARMYDSAHVA